MNRARQYHSDLATLLNGIIHVPSGLNTQVHGLVSDSRQVKQGDVFIALAGQNVSADTYVADAIAKGAAAVLIECQQEDQDKDREAHEDGFAVELYVPDLRNHLGELAHRFFHRPSEELQVIGVTGTNGKTSVANYIAQFFSSLGVSSAVIGTLGYGICAQGEPLIDTQHTTPGVVDVHRYLAHLRDAGAELVAMEVSSHGLTQGRLDGVVFEGAVFTNLSRDHLDYHGSMETYAAAKSKLFAWPTLKYAVINVDDAYAPVMFSEIAPEVRKIRYGIEQSAEIFATALDQGGACKGAVQVGTDSLDLDSPLVGRFNVYNLFAVLGVALARKARKEELGLINSVEPVSGRMQKITAPGKPMFVVDFAHTPDALENVLQTLRNTSNAKVITVFGCGGDRDTGKRSEMGAIAAELSDFTVLTSDNPRSEDPHKIISDIEVAFSDATQYAIEVDRASAIELAYLKANPEDIVLVAGKGHETYQEVRGTKTYFSDAEQCSALLGLTSEVRA